MSEAGKPGPSKAAEGLVPSRATSRGSGRRLRGAVAHYLGTAIVSGSIEPGSRLTGEVENAEALNVSRSAYREAVQVLTAKGLVASKPKDGTRVLPRSNWNLLDPMVLAWAFSGEPDPEFVRDLFELRAVVEPAIARLAAERRDKEDIRQMKKSLSDMRSHTLATEAGRAADREFHEALLRAARNEVMAMRSHPRGTIAIAPGRYADCAVQTAGSVSYLSAEPGAAIFDGRTCEGKAALVLRGRGAEVSGLVFQNMRVADFNGAGIRLEQGDLTVAETWFRDSQQGILTGDDGRGRVIVDRSTFTRLGTCEGSGGCAHSIYTGEYGHLRVTRSRFEEGRGGHYVKSRAARVDIASSSFDDAKGKGTNYMIDLPEGAIGQISNNWFVQGRDKENYSAFITVAPEEHRNSANGLQVVGNTARLAPGVSRETAFVADWSGDRIHIADNRLAGGIAPYERR